MTLMTRRSPASLLLLTGALLLLPFTVSAQTSLYDRMMEVSKKELMQRSAFEKHAELPVSAFTAKAVRAPQGVAVTREDIDPVLNDDARFCTDRGLSPGFCDSIRGSLQSIAKRETAIRALNRDLLIAAGYERALPVSSLDTDAFLMQMAAVTALWRVSGQTDAPAPISAKRVSDDNASALRSDVQTLTAALNALKETAGSETDDREFVAAVWGTRYGSLFAENESRDLWPDVWSALDAIANDVASLPVTPPGEGETIFLVLPEDLQSLLPENVRLWAYAENPEEGAIVTNAGLEWAEPVEPVQPDLCDWQNGECTAKPAGAYPTKPKETALCEHPLGRLGYLCRTIPETEETECLETPDIPSDVVALARCQAPGVPLETQAGPALCENWAEGKSAMLAETPACTVDLRCGGDDLDFDVATSTKAQDGTIQILVKETPSIPAKYLALSQMVHAKRMCAGPANTGILDGITDPDEQRAACCRVELDSTMAACNAMAEDGAFPPGLVSEDGFAINAETCAQLMAEDICRYLLTEDRGEGSSDDENDEGSSSSRTIPGVCRSFPAAILEDDELSNAVGTIAEAAVNALPEGESPQCSKTPFDPRIEAARNAVNDWRTNVCTPGNTVTFQGTIGDAQCYLGLCLSQSLREHRLTPGQNAGLAGGTAQPYDLCVPPSTDRGSIRTVPIAGLWTPPVYNPGFILKQVQTALCVGGAPSVLCSQNLERILQGSAGDPTAFGEATLSDESARLSGNADITAMTEALGQRLGHGMYADFLESRIGIINGVLDEAADGLEEMTRVRFPSTLCPVTAEDRSAFISSDLCSPLPRTP